MSSSCLCVSQEHGAAVNLELLRPTGACTETPTAAQSVYSVLNHTNTLTGALTLRSNLLEPPTGTWHCSQLSIFVGKLMLLFCHRQKLD